ncbi:hypothetical protein [Lentilactobacillus otakiensis]|uniref:hypothetical protein n=1 Tax=Lentilactobacillus otakiensis TaxID=481720 RepID=UPI003D17A4E2
MAKRATIIGLIVSAIILIFGFGMVTIAPFNKSNTQSHDSHPTATLKKKNQPLSMAELNRNPKLKYSCIIYFGIKNTTIQRWQELDDFEKGWQVEIYHRSGKTRFLVWPDRHITSQEKQLAPNWFEIQDNQHVIYHSFEVHTSKANEDQSYETTETHILKQINASHKARTVRKMGLHMTIVNRKATAQ